MTLSCELKVLREAASRQHWRLCFEISEPIFRSVGYPACLKVPLHFVESYLEKFKHHNPSEHWPDIRIQALKDFMLKPPPPLDAWWEWWDIPLPEAKDEKRYPTPGSNEFVRSLERLWRIPINTDDLEHCTMLAKQATQEIFAANLVELWGSTHPELWEQVRKENYWAFRELRTNEEGHRLHGELWLQFADEVENS